MTAATIRSQSTADEGLRAVVVVGEEVVDRGLRVDDRAEDAETTIEITPEQAGFLEKLNPCFRERHVESAAPGFATFVGFPAIACTLSTHCWPIHEASDETDYVY